MTLPLGGCYLLTSCNDVKDMGSYTDDALTANTAAPIITGVYDVSDIEGMTPLHEGERNQMLRIEGSNLNYLKSLKFNTIPADLSIVYTQSTKAIVRVPNELSFEHVNKIEYTTDLGTATWDFVIPQPALKVTGLFNEFVNAGMEAQITGENFNLYGFTEGYASVEINGTPVALTDITADALTFNIPEGTADNSTISVRWSDTEGAEQQATMPYRPTTGIIFNSLSSIQKDKTDSHVTIETDEDVESDWNWLNGEHLHFVGDLAAWAWVELSFSQNLPAIEGVDTPDDYNFCFEVLTAPNYPFPSSYNNNMDGFMFGWNWSSDKYEWTPEGGDALNTFGKWKTIRIPLTEVAVNGIGTVGSWMTMNIVFQPINACSVDFRMGNFRIEHK